MGDEDFIRRSLFMIGGLLVWAAHFGVVYVFNALACARGFVGTSVLGFGLVPFVVVATTILALAAAGAILLLAYRHTFATSASPDEKPVSDFLRYTTMAVAALSLVAIAWNGLPALIVPPCG